MLGQRRVFAVLVILNHTGLPSKHRALTLCSGTSPDSWKGGFGPHGNILSRVGHNLKIQKNYMSKSIISSRSPGDGPILNRQRVNPLTVNLFNLNFHPLEVVSRWRDPQLQVSENYSDLTKWRSTVFKYCWLMAHFIFNMFKMWYIMF